MVLLLLRSPAVLLPLEMDRISPTQSWLLEAPLPPSPRPLPLLTNESGFIFAFNHTLTRTCCGAGTMDTWGPPAGGLIPVAAPRPPYTCAQQVESPSHWIELESHLTRKQDRLRWSGTGHGQTSVPTSPLFTYDQPFLSPYSSIFPHLLLTKSPKSIPFPVFGSFPKLPVQSPNSVPPRPIMCPTPLFSSPTSSQR